LPAEVKALDTSFSWESFPLEMSGLCWWFFAKAVLFARETGDHFPLKGGRTTSMPISRNRKEELVAHYVELLKESQGIVITANQGMNMAQFNDIRAKLREQDSTYVVTKNTLLRLALEQVGLPLAEELFQGPVGVAFARQDVSAVAKTVLEFTKGVELFQVRGALVGAEIYDAKGVDTLSKLPSIEELHAQLVGIIIAPASGLASVINGGVTQVLNVIAAYVAKDESAAEAA
jgi:large subunit ribosomal protein L10